MALDRENYVDHFGASDTLTPCAANDPEAQSRWWVFADVPVNAIDLLGPAASRSGSAAVPGSGHDRCARQNLGCE
jgi:hypothetical protein